MAQAKKFDKTTGKDKIEDSPSVLSHADLSRRFGAVGFVETHDEPEDGDADILSLDALRAAFATVESEEEESVANGDDESGDPNDDGAEKFEENALSEHEPEEIFPDSTVDFSVGLNPKNIFEAMLFVGDRHNRPLRAERAIEKMRNVTVDEIGNIADELNAEYQKLGSPYVIQREDAGFRMVLRPEFQPVLERFYGKIREATLSQQAIDTLAIVAYRQPISADAVQKIRKQPAAAVLSQLVRRGLIEQIVEGQGKKKTAHYRTTERFLELFQLESLDDLPTPEDLN